MTRHDDQTNNAPAAREERWIAEILGRLKGIQARIAAAARRAGRSPESVALVAVSKTHPAALIAAARAAGQRVFGESRLQEALPKIEALERTAPPPEWHLIGHLQRNKVAQAAGRFALIHSVDSVRLIEELEKQCAARGIDQRILLEINVSGEASKFGAPPEELPFLLAALEKTPHLRGEGLMTIPPYDLDPEAVRPHFARLRDLMAGLGERPNFTPRHLSMGMSGDFEVAIEEGATLVRVGTAIFGERE